MNSFKRVRAFKIELEFEMLVFKKRGKPEQRVFKECLVGWVRL